MHLGAQQVELPPNRTARSRLPSSSSSSEANQSSAAQLVRLDRETAVGRREQDQPSSSAISVSERASSLPITVISALLFYFGYVSSRAQYEYFGIDVDTIGLSTQDYVMRSPQSLLVPLLALVVIGLALVVASSVDHCAHSGGGAGPDGLPIVRRTLRAQAWSVFSRRDVLVILYPVARRVAVLQPGNAGGGRVGAGVVAYTWRLVARLAPAEHRAKPLARSPTLRRMGLVLLCFLVVATVFWSTATIAQWSGRGLARHRPRVTSTTYQPSSSTPRSGCSFSDPGVKETALWYPPRKGRRSTTATGIFTCSSMGRIGCSSCRPAWSASDTSWSCRWTTRFGCGSSSRMIRPDRYQPVRTMSGAPNRAASAVASSRWF